MSALRRQMVRPEHLHQRDGRCTAKDYPCTEVYLASVVDERDKLVLEILKDVSKRLLVYPLTDQVDIGIEVDRALAAIRAAREEA